MTQSLHQHLTSCGLMGGVPWVRSSRAGMLWGARRYPCQCPQCRTQKLCSCRSITMEKLQHTLRIPVSRLARVKSLRHPRPPVRVQPEVKSNKLVLSAQPPRQTSCNICTYASPIHLSSTLVFALAERTGGGSLELFTLARFLPCGGASPMNNISGREKGDPTRSIPTCAPLEQHPLPRLPLAGEGPALRPQLPPAETAALGA